MKETLKIEINDDNELQNEVQDLLFSLGCRWLNLADGEYCEYRIKSHLYALLDKKIIMDRDVTDYRVINIEELRELAQPKEYLNDKFELVETNQPDDGFILVPNGAEYYAKQIREDSDAYFYKDNNMRFSFYNTFYECYEPSFVPHSTLLFKILWQREKKVETVKGRFLHQWAYDAFGRGEDVQHTPCERDCDWTSTSIASPISIFSAREMKFRLKPQTIQIGSRTITKPISVKPEIGDIVYVANLTDISLCTEQKWNNNPLHIHFFDLGLLHKSKEDALNHSMALIETMK